MHNSDDLEPNVIKARWRLQALASLLGNAGGRALVMDPNAIAAVGDMIAEYTNVLSDAFYEAYKVDDGGGRA